MKTIREQSLNAYDITLAEKTVVSFAAIDQARRCVSENDDFIKRLSRFDRSARMKVDGQVSEEDFRSFLAENAVEWGIEEIRKLTRVFGNMSGKLSKYAAKLPDKITMVKTTGKEECNSAYTRGNSIILPPGKLEYPEDRLERLIIHEIFHIITRNDPALRESLYSAIGFIKCGDIELPADIKGRAITNPDAHRNDHFILVSYEDMTLPVIPIIYSCDAMYDTVKGGEIFDYLVFRFLVIRKNVKEWIPALKNGGPILLDPRQVSGFYEQVGRDTDHIIHPEEILAENFTQLVMLENDLPPHLVIKLGTLLCENLQIKKEREHKPV